MASGYLLGIDVGTTRTAAATCRIGAWPSECEIVNLGDRSSAVPSVLFVGDDGGVLVGEAAERRATSEPDHVVREFKRRIGDPTPVLVSGRPWAPEDLAARLVQWVVERVTQREGGPATHLAVTHPASWGAHKKDLLGAALHRHGLPVAFLAEPQAAALHYAAAERVEPGSTIAVYDFGGGTFDAAVVHKDAQGFSLLGRPEGVERLGGIDLDELVFEHVVEGLPEAFDGLDEDDPAVLSAVAAVRRECTEAKEALSADTEVSIPVLTPVGQGSVRLHRSEFEAMIHPHVEETVSALRRAIASAGVGADQLTAVLLVGGSSRIPLVAQMVSEQLGRPVAVDADPKNAIAKGAALSLTPAGISATGAYAPAPRGHGSGPVAPHGAAGAPLVTGSNPSWPAPQRPTGAYAAAATEAFAPTQRMSSSRPSGADGAAGPAAAAGVRVRRRRVLLRPAATATAQPGRARRRGGCGGRRGRARDGVPVAAARGVDGEPRHGADRRRHHHRRRAHHRGRPHHHAGAGRAEAAARAAHGRRAAPRHDDGGSAAHHHRATADDHVEARRQPARSRPPPRRHRRNRRRRTPTRRTWRPSEWAPSPRVRSATAARG